jgi:hypothetical protein
MCAIESILFNHIDLKTLDFPGFSGQIHAIKKGYLSSSPSRGTL